MDGDIVHIFCKRGIHPLGCFLSADMLRRNHQIDIVLHPLAFALPKAQQRLIIGTKLLSTAVQVLGARTVFASDLLDLVSDFLFIHRDSGLAALDIVTRRKLGPLHVATGL